MQTKKGRTGVSAKIKRAICDGHCSLEKNMICAILTNALDHCQPPLFPALTSVWFKRNCRLANVLIAIKFLNKIGLIFSSAQTAYLLNAIASTSSYLLDWVS